MAEYTASTFSIGSAFARCKKASRPCFVGFVTAGYPTQTATADNLIAMEEGGTDVIEVGLPFTDPLAEGPTIQMSSQLALKNGMTTTIMLEQISDARKRGLTAPLIIMGYYNPMRSYGMDKLAKDAAAVGVGGFIIVDLPPEEATAVLEAFQKHGVSFIPLVTPETTEERMARLTKLATSFVYCVSVRGVTGSRTAVPEELPAFVAKVKTYTDLPVAVGFGISTPEHVKTIGQYSDGVVVGSAIIKVLQPFGEGAKPEDRSAALKKYIGEMVGGDVTPGDKTEGAPNAKLDASVFKSEESIFNFGKYGGRYIPETLVKAHERLWEEYKATKADPSFQAELARLRKDYVGGPTPVWLAERLTASCGGARIWLKREDLAHTGAHKINNALAQVLLAKRLGKTRVIAETGAGQHGVATATACSLLGIECVVYMGFEDTQRQALNVFRMKILGAEVVPVRSGAQTLKDAINEAMRDWVTNVETTHYCVGSAIGPHPFPTMVRDFQAVMGREARASMLEQAKKLPDVVVACVGGGSNAIGIFHPFFDDKDVKFVGVEAGGETGISGLHSAPLTNGQTGVLHGTFTYLMQDLDGQIAETHSISAGLDYPGVGPEHAWYKDSGRAEYVCVTDKEALDGLLQLSKMEGIIPALETAHAVHYAIELAKKMPKDSDILVNLSGRGDKDMVTVAKALGVILEM